MISKEPLGPAVRHGDNEWADVVRWTFFAMLQAEEFGINIANVEQVKGESKNPDVQRFLGVIEEKGKELGMPNDFAVQVINQVGNYGESFDRNVGPKTPLKIQRGLNALWKNGGLHVQPAVPLSLVGLGACRASSPSLAVRPVEPRATEADPPMRSTISASEPPRVAIYNDPRARALFYQLLVLLFVLGGAAILVTNTMTNLARLGVASGFGFLGRPAGFDIGQAMIDYSAPRARSAVPSSSASSTRSWWRRRHRPGDDHRLHHGHRPAVAQLAGLDAGLALRRDRPQHPAAAAAAL